MGQHEDERRGEVWFGYQVYSIYQYVRKFKDRFSIDIHTKTVLTFTDKSGVYPAVLVHCLVVRWYNYTANDIQGEKVNTATEDAVNPKRDNRVYWCAVVLLLLQYST